ncbi:TQXA domain-containing protein [Mycobacterium sp. E2462]|uniref:TQXA domain-containing protein n=1 Tax=unclassified Mycobacterium TaxID=2642494 RepID=UPI0007FC3F95|nr:MULTISPECIES: TQXA domain-containing protein [unclassified Mycobacterium]OBG72212.1 TQXA domain-containing protein [Mycobacterium sp. E1214]OBH31152.1 TQXA domain-containing protein [Mycobacterium sp. E1319]OBI15820.1 TQXA domain-containing protein [Mycobacterium sp. E2462]
MTVLSIPPRASAPVTTRRRVLVRPTTEVTRMTRYRGGTYSHTVDTIEFVDGSRARTDLIRLNPNLRAYSLDFCGIAPDRPTRYRLGTWSTLPHLHTRGHEAEVDWILRNSFPMRTTAQLSGQLRAAGYLQGPANISEHHAIAATQAAIWQFTNGLALDTRPRNVPVRVQRGPGPSLTFEFDGEPQLGGYSVWTEAAGPVHLRLQKSTNGTVWQDVSGSHLTVDAGAGRHQRTLGVGSTLSASRHGRAGSGYRHYRLLATAQGGDPTIDEVRFWLTDTRHYRNADMVVHLYNYLIDGARNAARGADELRLVEHQATADSHLVGPFQVPIPLALSVTEGHTLVDADGAVIRDIVEPGSDFYLRPAPGTSATTMTAKTAHNLTGRVLTGVALDGAPYRLTPIALTVPTDVAIEFDIIWQANEPCSDTA